MPFPGGVLRGKRPLGAVPAPSEPPPGSGFPDQRDGGEGKRASLRWRSDFTPSVQWDFDRIDHARPPPAPSSNMFSERLSEMIPAPLARKERPGLPAPAELSFLI